MKRFAAVVLVLLSCTAIAQPPNPAPAAAPDLLQASPAGDWRDLDPENTLYVELPAGRVVIELAAHYAPAAASAIRRLVRDRYFDASFVVRTQDNYVVQWARPETDARAKAMAGPPGLDGPGCFYEVPQPAIILKVPEKYLLPTQIP